MRAIPYLMLIVPLVTGCGTKAEQGINGSLGEEGASGEDGEEGASGEDGEGGASGEDGEGGVPGEDGEDGAPGEDGEDGAPGEDGEDGAPGEDGEGGAPGEDGEDGDPGEDGEDGDPGEDGGGGSAGGSDTGGVYLGDLTLRSEIEAEYFCSHYDRVYGELIVDYSAEDLSALACLVEVTQDFALEDHGVISISLPNLQRVGQTLMLRGDLVEEAHFPALEEVGDFLNLEGVGRDAESPSISFESLHTVEAHLVVMYIGASTVDFSSLETAGDILIHDCDRLENLDGFEALNEVNPGTLQIADNDLLVDVTGLSGVTYIHTSLEFSNNPILPTSMAESVAAGVEYVGAGIAIYGNGPG
jgi:hypothetical protein